MFENTLLSQYIYKSKYSRYLEKEGRRENWFETVTRYLEFVKGYLSDNHGYTIDDGTYSDLCEAILNHEVMPSMRALMTAGKAAERNHIALYNCLSGDTIITTLEYGLVPLRDISGKKVHIVDGNGNWTLSECKSFGNQQLYKINLATSGVGKFSFRATENHRWIDDQNNILFTSNLKNGTKLANVKMADRIEINDNSDDYRKGIIHGIIYGDGTATYKGYGRQIRDVYCDKICDAFIIRLCGKSRDLIKYFDKLPCSYPKSYNGDPVIRLSNPTIDLKSLPEVEWFNDDYIVGFIRGWFAADGSISSTNKQTNLACIKEGMDWIYRYGPKYGFVPLNYYQFPSETNYGVRKKDLFKIEFDRRWLRKDDFILQYKQDLFKTFSKRNGKVVSVEKDKVEEVFCFEVSTTHSFLLTKNIITGNCSYLPMDSEKSFDETVAISMSGTGVGYSVESRYTKQLEELPDNFYDSETTVIFDDSRVGWAKGYREFIAILLTGQVPKYDVSKLRPAGARLRTMGGRSSGPEPLVDLLEFTVQLFKRAAGRSLTTLEVHDLACKIGDIVVVGGVRRCLIGSTRVQTFDGYTNIKDLTVGDTIIVKGKTHRVIDKVYSGKQKVFNIKHKFGEIKGATTNHEVATFSSLNEYIFKSVSSLTKNDVLVWDGYGTSGSRQKLPNFIQSEHFNSKDVKFPEYLDVKLAWLIGLVQGDGYVTSKTIEISGNEDDWLVLEYAQSIFKEYFDINSSLGRDSHKGKGIRLRVNSVSLCSWFHQFIKQSNTPIRIPNFIFASEKDVRYAYLAGLFDADGRVTPDGGVDQLTTIYKEFKDDVITLLSNLGIGNSLYFKSNDVRCSKGVNAKDYYTIRIRGRINRGSWNSVLGYSQSIKKDSVKEYTGKNHDFSWPLSIHKVKNGFRGDMSYLTSVERGLVVDKGIYPTKIISITECGEEDTYDIEVEDVHEFTIDGVIVHNSAFISLSDLLDHLMRGAKTGNWYDAAPYRRLANNSAVYESKPDIGVFMTEWLSLYNSKSGERGIISRAAMKRVIENSNDFRRLHFTVDKDGNYAVRFRETDHEFGCNPCSEIILRPYEFCVSGSTPLITKYGIHSINSLENKSVDIWNGQKWSNVIVRKTRENQELVRVLLSDGSYLDCTPDHKFSVKNRFEKEYRKVEAKDLISEKYVLSCETFLIDDKNEFGRSLSSAYTLGFAVGDGYVYKDKVGVDLYGDKDIKCPLEGKRYKKYTPKGYNVEKQRVITDLDPNLVKELKTDAKSILELAKYNKSDVIDFISGLADADGSQASNGVRIYLSGEDRARALQLVLTRFGIKSSVNLLHKAGTKTNLAVRKKDLWYIQITKTNELRTFRLVTDNDNYPKFKGKYQTIVDVIPLEELEDVYCFTEHEKHMGVFGNVLTYQCNLTEVIIHSDDTPETLKRKVRIATILGTFQSCFTKFKYINKKWQKNCEDERLLGVSLTGIMDNTYTNGRRTGFDLVGLLEDLKFEAIRTNMGFASLLGINSSVAITCVKPSGTSSSLNGTASGIHHRHAPYYIRYFRNDIKDPLTDFMIDNGFPFEKDAYDPAHVVTFKFPVKPPSTSVFKSDQTAIEHLELWLLYQKHWCEHKPSITVSVREDEWLDVGAWVYKNFEWVSGISFLPADEGTTVYKQAPYTTCTKDQYELLLAQMPKDVDWSGLSNYENEDMTTGSQELACSGAGGCEVF